MKKMICVVLCFVCFALAAQDNNARLTTVIGSHIEFNFNSLTDYENGVRITDGTTIAITMSEISPAVLSGWHIDVQSFSGQATLDGAGGNTLPLNSIQIEATDANGNLSSAIFNGLQDLSIAPGNTLMITTSLSHVPTNPNTHQINLSYECGMANGSLLGQAGDYYTVNVEIILIPDF